MDDSIKSLGDLLIALTNLLPGFILLYTRSRFTNAGPLPSLKENVALYVVLSAAYFILAGPVFDLDRRLGSSLSAYLLKLLLVFLIPALLGATLGIMGQRRTLSRAFMALIWLFHTNITLVDPTQTAWDWKFASLPTSFVIIKLKSGATVYGLVGPNSFVSSDPDERDLYIEQVYSMAADGSWTSSGEKGIWIASGELSTIELIPEAGA